MQDGCEMSFPRVLLPWESSTHDIPTGRFLELDSDGQSSAMRGQNSSKQRTYHNESLLSQKITPSMAYSPTDASNDECLAFGDSGSNWSGCSTPLTGRDRWFDEIILVLLTTADELQRIQYEAISRLTEGLSWATSPTDWAWLSGYSPGHWTQ